MRKLNNKQKQKTWSFFATKKILQIQQQPEVRRFINVIQVGSKAIKLIRTIQS